MEYRNLSSAAPLYVGMTFPQPDTDDVIDVRSARAHVVDASGRQIESVALVCTLRSTQDSAIGSGDEAMVRQTCSSVVPAEGISMHLGREHGQQLVLAVTASGSGSVVIEGMDVTYRHGLQLGTQRVGGTLKLSTPGA